MKTIPLTVCCMMFGLVASTQAMAADDAHHTPTRFGQVDVSANQFLLNGKPLKPNLTGNSGIILNQVKSVGDTDYVVLETIGGTACPAFWTIVALTAHGAKPINWYGTCSDMGDVKFDGDRIAITMPEMKGSQKSTYVYKGGVVKLNGKVVDTTCKKGQCDGF